MRRPARLLACVGTAVVLVGCSGDSEPTATAPTPSAEPSRNTAPIAKAELVRQGDEFCGSDPKVKLASAGQSSGQGGRGYEEQSDGTSALAERLRSLGVPDQDEPALKRYLAGLDQSGRNSAGLSAAAEKGDKAKLAQLVEVQRGIQKRLRRHARQFGFAVCGVPEEFSRPSPTTSPSPATTG